MLWLGFIPWWVWVPYLVLWLYVMATLIMEDREPADTLAWAFALLLVPVLGMIFYFFAGRDWAIITEKKGALRAHVDRFLAALAPFFERNAGADRRFRQLYAGTYIERLSDTIHREDGLGVVTADSAEIFPTGAEKFGRLKADLAAAQRFIHVQYFIWENDELTDALTAILKERVQAGVQVRFLYDDLGSKHWDKSKLEALVPLGMKLAKDVSSLSHVNYRDHRKIVVIDGEIGYTGGYNVGQEYIDGGERFARWRDTHLRVTGQIVGELQALFASRWFDQTKEDVLTDEFLPAHPRGDGEAGVLCQVVAQAVQDPWQSSRRAHMLAIGNAGRRAWIQSPYFIPEVGLYDTMITAALSGVDVRFMMTGVPDKKVPYWAAWTYFRFEDDQHARHGTGRCEVAIAHGRHRDETEVQIDRRLRLGTLLEEVGMHPVHPEVEEGEQQPDHEVDADRADQQLQRDPAAREDDPEDRQRSQDQQGEQHEIGEVVQPGVVGREGHDRDEHREPLTRQRSTRPLWPLRLLGGPLGARPSPGDSGAGSQVA